MSSQRKPRFDAKGQPIPEETVRIALSYSRPGTSSGADAALSPSGAASTPASGSTYVPSENVHLVFGDTGGPKQPDSDKCTTPAAAAKEPGRFVPPEPSMDSSAPNSAERK